MWRGFQPRYVFLVAGSLTVLLLFAGLHNLYVTNQIFPGELGDLAQAELKASTIRLLLVGFLYIAVVTFAAIFLSHRAFGPVGRLEEEVKRLIESDGAGHAIKVREGDDLEPVVNAINALVKKTRNTK